MGIPTLKGSPKTEQKEENPNPAPKQCPSPLQKTTRATEGKVGTFPSNPSWKREESGTEKLIDMSTIKESDAASPSLYEKLTQKPEKGGQEGPGDH